MAYDSVNTNCIEVPRTCITSAAMNSLLHLFTLAALLATVRTDFAAQLAAFVNETVSITRYWVQVLTVCSRPGTP